MQKKKRNQVNESSWLTGFQLVEFKLKNTAKHISVTLYPKSVKSFVISKKSKSTYLYMVVTAKEKQ